ncbi:aldo/keto reductase [Prauserella endophytica]|uniref:Aldo/keto reductase n=1 Tax=Prauserella endophytica TaxID=1592324 RepID=A0ABY2S6S3_9PSEU|nr:aldo/keto reductase [Prauserella endophytica]TKG71608.1 aldo/keto reductase [Prauserella endophytica]
MRYRPLGQTGLRVSELFLGTMAFGAPVPESDCREMLDGFADAGGNAIDTAVVYRGGESERILGELLRGRRDRFVLGTKYALSRDATDPNASGNHRKNLRLSLETSLRRLRTDYLDLYWVHVWDLRTPAEEILRALDDAVRTGKVLHVGISDTPAWWVSRANQLAESRGWTPFSAVQVPYNLLWRDVERELLPMAEALGLSVTTWNPLAGGVLSGRYLDGGTGGGRRDPATLTERDHAAARVVRDVAGELGATPSQVAIAWLLARSPSVLPILGPRTPAQLKDALGAAGLELPGEAIERLTGAVPFERGFPADFLEGLDI